MKGDPNKIDKKILIPLIRKYYPRMLADQIVNVQPMQTPTGSIFRLNVRYSAEAWRKKIILWPIKSIYGKFIFGLINERGVWKEVTEAFGGNTSHSERVVEYATNKELFKARLDGRE